MKNLLVVMTLLVISTLAYGNASPPDDIGIMNLNQVVTADVDNFVIDVPTFETDVYTIDLPEVATVKPLSEKDAVFVMVREVTACRKISLSKAESGVATENATMALNSACTDNNVTQSPPLRDSANVATNTNYFDLQHTNYGYPLSAN